MLIGHFTEQPWQDDKTGLMGNQSLDLGISNQLYDPMQGAKLYNRDNSAGLTCFRGTLDVNI